MIIRIKKKTLASFALIFILLAIAINADKLNSTNYNQTVVVSDGGATKLNSTNYNHSITVGGVIGRTTSGNYENRLGFFYGTFADNTTPFVNATLNNTSPKRYEIVNISAYASDESGLTLGEIIVNQTGSNVIYSFTLSGGSAFFSQNITIGVARANVINFTARVTDGSGNLKQNSTLITVANTPPPQVTLTYPNNDNYTINRTPLMAWSNVTDIDNDSLAFNVIMTCIGCSSDNRDFNVTTINTTPEFDLQFLGDEGYTYNWSVRATDNPGTSDSSYGTMSSIRNITVLSYVSATFAVNSVDFGQLSLGQNDNTTDSSPPPFTIENDGNVKINATIFASGELFSSVSMPSRYFQYKFDNTTEVYSFNYSTSTVNFTNFTSAGVFGLHNFNYQDGNDSAKIDINVEVPPAETTGTKSSKVAIQVRRSA
ncbi:MAG TPA: hypothetical protein VI564_05315 [Candidatus Nanoarchaeia archaeon]|nr:hypothetical protein [Candidatus Nanoarchaeia archaeon]